MYNETSIAIIILPHESDNWLLNPPFVGYPTENGYILTNTKSFSVGYSDYTLIPSSLVSVGNTYNKIDFMRQSRIDQDERNVSNGMGGLAKLKDFLFSFIFEDLLPTELYGRIIQLRAYDGSTITPDVDEDYYVHFQGSIHDTIKNSKNIREVIVRGSIDSNNSRISGEPYLDENGVVNNSFIFLGVPSDTGLVKLDKKSGSIGIQLGFDDTKYEIEEIFIKDKDLDEFYPVTSPWSVSDGLIFFDDVESVVLRTDMANSAKDNFIAINDGVDIAFQLEEGYVYPAYLSFKDDDGNRLWFEYIKTVEISGSDHGIYRTAVTYLYTERVAEHNDWPKDDIYSHTALDSVGVPLGDIVLRYFTYQSEAVKIARKSALTIDSGNIPEDTLIYKGEAGIRRKYITGIPKSDEVNQTIIQIGNERLLILYADDYYKRGTLRWLTVVRGFEDTPIEQHLAGDIVRILNSEKSQKPEVKSKRAMSDLIWQDSAGASNNLDQYNSWSENPKGGYIWRIDKQDARDWNHEFLFVDFLLPNISGELKSFYITSNINIRKSNTKDTSNQDVIGVGLAMTESPYITEFTDDTDIIYHSRTQIGYNKYALENVDANDPRDIHNKEWFRYLNDLGPNSIFDIYKTLSPGFMCSALIVYYGGLFEYTFRDALSIIGPNDIKYNELVQHDTSEIRISYTDVNNKFFNVIFQYIETGKSLFVFNKSDNSNYDEWRIDTITLDSTLEQIVLDVTFLNGSGADFSSAQAVNVRIEDGTFDYGYQINEGNHKLRGAWDVRTANANGSPAVRSKYSLYPTDPNKSFNPDWDQIRSAKFALHVNFIDWQWGLYEVYINKFNVHSKLRCPIKDNEWYAKVKLKTTDQQNNTITSTFLIGNNASIHLVDNYLFAESDEIPFIIFRLGGNGILYELDRLELPEYADIADGYLVEFDDGEIGKASNKSDGFSYARTVDEDSNNFPDIVPGIFEVVKLDAVNVSKQSIDANNFVIVIDGTFVKVVKKDSTSDGNPVTLLKRLLIEYGGHTESQIDDDGTEATSFGKARIARQNHKCSVILEEEVNGNSVIDKFSKNNMLVPYERDDGLIGLINLDPQEIEITNELTDSNIIFDGKYKSLKEKNIDMRYLITDLNLRYKPFANKFKVDLKNEDLTGELQSYLETAQTYTGRNVNQVAFHHESTHDDYTAMQCATIKMLYHHKPSAILNVGVTLNTTRIELGSWVTINSSLIDGTGRRYLVIGKKGIYPVGTKQAYGQLELFEYDITRLVSNIQETPDEVINNNYDEVISDDDQIQEVP